MYFPKRVSFVFTVQSFDTIDRMENLLNQDNAMKKFLVGVRFDNVTPNTTLPKNTIVSDELSLLVYG